MSVTDANLLQDTGLRWLNKLATSCYESVRVEGNTIKTKGSLPTEMCGWFKLSHILWNVSVIKFVFCQLLLDREITYRSKDVDGSNLSDILSLPNVYKSHEKMESGQALGLHIVAVLKSVYKLLDAPSIERWVCVSFPTIWVPWLLNH